MRLFKCTGDPAGDSHNMSLLALSEFTDWDDQEFEDISQLKVGERVKVGSPTEPYYVVCVSD